MSRIKPGKNNIPQKSRIPVPNPPPDANIRFSFRYVKQIEYFQWGTASNTQFIALLERLRDIEANYTRPSLGQLGSAFHYHAVKFSQPGCPVKYSDLDWFPEEYRDEQTFPIYQISITASLGRIHGFWDSDNTTFHIILVDFCHNMQPSKSRGYKVDSTTLLPTDYEALRACINECDHQPCPCRDLHTLTPEIISFKVDSSLLYSDDGVKISPAHYSYIFELGREKYITPSPK